MRKWGTFCMVWALAGASALGFTDITIHDNDANETGAWQGTQEDDEATPYFDPGQVWDLEAFVLADDGTLWLIGGYDFRDGQQGWDPGHVFVSTDGTVNYGQTTVGTQVPGTSFGGLPPVSNTAYDYEYALVPDFGAGTYDVFGLADDQMLLSVFFSDLESANPWRLANPTGGSLGGALMFYDYGSSELADLLANLGNAGISFSDGGGDDTRYALGLQGFTSAIGGAGEFVVHYTYECGNDQMMGEHRVADAGTTLLLIGISLLGLEGMRRRNLQTDP